MTGQAGTLESNDILIVVTSGEGANGIEIELQSEVMMQYEAKIREAITKAVLDRGVTSLQVRAMDKGALDSTIRARVFTAMDRAGL